MTGDEALDQIANWWRGVDKSYYHPYAPQTHEQHAYIRYWAEPTGGRP